VLHELVVDDAGAVHNQLRVRQPLDLAPCAHVRPDCLCPPIRHQLRKQRGVRLLPADAATTAATATATAAAAAASSAAASHSAIPTGSHAARAR